MPYVPTNYTTTPANSNPNLIEHLTGIDNALGGAAANLAWANQTATTGDVTSSTGTNATLTSATALLAGLMTSADFIKVRDLPTIPATIGAATQILQVNAGGTALEYVAQPTGVTDLAYTAAAAQGTVTSSTGNDATLPLVDATNAGLMAPADFTKIGLIPNALGTANQILRVNAGATALEYVTSAAVDLGYTASPTNGVVTNSDGTDSTIPLGDATNAGLIQPADFTKLSNIAVTQAVDLDAMETDIAEHQTLLGVPDASTDLGNFTGTLLGDGTETVKTALQALETAVESVPTRIQTVVPTIAARDAQTGLAAGDLTWVVDASADATVDAGGALYIHDGTNFFKVAEAEALDVVTDLAVANVTATSLDVTSSTGTDATLPAATNAAAGVATAAQITNLESLIALSGIAADLVNFGTLLTGDIARDNATLLQALIDIEAGAQMATATQANLLDAANPINTTGKFQGRKVRVTDRDNIVVFSRGTGATDSWGDSGNIYEATPV